jgi:hypothetical protein
MPFEARLVWPLFPILPSSKGIKAMPGNLWKKKISFPQENSLHARNNIDIGFEYQYHQRIQPLPSKFPTLGFSFQGMVQGYISISAINMDLLLSEFRAILWMKCRI